MAKHREEVDIVVEDRVSKMNGINKMKRRSLSGTRDVYLGTWKMDIEISVSKVAPYFRIKVGMNIEQFYA